jgi:hypothetical protein
MATGAGRRGLQAKEPAMREDLFKLYTDLRERITRLRGYL